MRILVVEDDETLCQTVCDSLSNNGYDSEMCLNGGDAKLYIENYTYDLIILDRMLPEADGISVLKFLRNKKLTVPVIMVTALNGLEDKIDGLDAGADDYLPKPFAMKELLARIRALLRRPQNYTENSLIECGGVSFSPVEKVLIGKNCEVRLSAKEAGLLEFFIRHDGQTLKREQIICSVWGADAEIEDGNLDNFIYFLRRRFKAAESKSTIKTIYGIGYKPLVNKNEK